LNGWVEFKRETIEDCPEYKPFLNWVEDQGVRLMRHGRSHSLSIVVGAVFSFLVAAFFVAVYKFKFLIVNEAGPTGDFIAGTIGTVLGLVSVIALFITLKNDRLAKEEEGFEDKYYQLLKLHRSNVAEIRLGNATGRRVFVLLIREFRCILDQIRDLADRQRATLSRQELICASYFAFFYGVGPNSSRMLIQALVNVGFREHLAGSIAAHLDDAELKAKVKLDRKFAHTPFEGHQSRLGHYFRHLYQMVTYIHLQKMKDLMPWLTPEEEQEKKYQYIKTIRAQLSTHEQALFLLNSLTPIGKVWWDEKIIVRYGLVKNIPKAFFEQVTEIDVDKHFTGPYFEDDEIRLGSGQPWPGWPSDSY
jgi:hypothetical protein